MSPATGDSLPASKRRVAIVGASGFTGKECYRLLAEHPSIEVAGMWSARREPSPHQEYAGSLHELPSLALDLDAIGACDAAMLCAPHQASAELAPAILERGARVIDLSAAYRLRDPQLYPRFYGFEHPHPELLETRVYGLTEWAHDALADARLVANPGCYVTSALLPMMALRAAGLVDDDADIIADCKSGVSGAGKGATPVTHFASVYDDFRAYGVGTHRHEPEIREQLGSDAIYFTPHLLPLFRGILTTLHFRTKGAASASEVRAALQARYEASAFVQVLEDGLPSLAAVQGSNRCVLGVAAHGDRVVVVSCLDNLVKGAAGQAVQNLNVALGLDETAGLGPTVAAIPGWRI